MKLDIEPYPFSGLGGIKSLGGLKGFNKPDIEKPTFFLPLGTEGPIGVSALPAALTINGTTVNPTFRYLGGDAGNTWAADTYGESLTLQAGSPSYNQGSPGMGDTDDSVKGDGTAYWKASSTSFADIDEEDFVFEALVKVPVNP